MPSEPLVSVVTPVYNTGEYLEQAIRSVLAQSHQNFEYIICNNHSTDDSGSVAERYAKLDARIRVIQPPSFLSQAKNFNFALQHVSTESRYCKLILADDLMLPECLREMVALAEQNPSVAMVSSYRLIETVGDCFGLRLDQKVIPGRVAGRLNLLSDVFLFGTPSTVLYRADIVRARNPHFYPENRFYFDSDVAFEILRKRDFGFVHQVLTFSRYQPESITYRERELYSGSLDRLICVRSHGPVYLTREEYSRAIALAQRRYYGALGRHWLRERLHQSSPEFWEYHKTRLATANLEIDRARLAVGVGRAFMKTIASPLSFALAVAQRLRPPEDPWRPIDGEPHAGDST